MHGHLENDYLFSVCTIDPNRAYPGIIYSELGITKLQHRLEAAAFGPDQHQGQFLSPNFATRCEVKAILAVVTIAYSQSLNSRLVFLLCFQ